jgi:glycosyltransferase involved in cell wall biosynthesis
MEPAVHFRGIVLGPSGFAAQGRELLALLEASGLRPSLHGARLGEVDGGETAAERELIARCALRPPQPGRVTVQHVLPPHFVPDPEARADVVSTVFETAGLPGGWGPHLAGAAAVVVPAPAIAAAFARGGVPADLLHAIAPPVAMAPFTPGRAGHPLLPPRRPHVLRWLSVLDWSLRKGVDVLLPAFARAFRRDDAELVLKVAAKPGLDPAGLQRHCRQVAAAACPGAAPAVHVVGALLEQEELAALYAGCDAFVLASRGEGWGRPVHEAMLMELPVVATQAGALADLLPDAGAGFPVRCRQAPVSAAAAAQTPVFHGQEWWEPDSADLERQLLLVARDREGARARGRRAREHVLRLCAHEGIARAWTALLAEVSGAAVAPALPAPRAGARPAAGAHRATRP